MVRRRRLVAPLVVALVASLCSLVAGIQPAAAKAPSPMAPSLVNVGVTSAGPAGDGYWEVTDGGLVAPLREAPDDPLPAWYGDMSGSSLNAPIVGIAGHPNGGGYWFVGRDGGVFAYGSAGFFGGSPANNIVGITATPDGGGYWLLGADGGIFAYGNAPFKGSLGGQGYTDVVGMAAMPSGQGYWLVRANGTIYSYGDAGYHGGAAASNIVGMARTFDGGGYWLLGADGAIYADNAPYYGRGAVLCCGFTYSAIVAKRGVHHGYRPIGRNTSDFPSLEDNQSPTGAVDENSHTQVAGWAVDPNETTKSINVQIKVDGIERYNQATAGSRPDVNVALHGISGNHGFIWNIATAAPDLLNAQPHTVQVYAIDSGLPAPQLAPLLLNQTTWTSPNLAPVGIVQEADGARIRGWVHDPNAPSQALNVNIYIDGIVRATVAANASRPNNNPPLTDGFVWAVPTTYRDGQQHAVTVKALDYPANTETAISNPTLTFAQVDDTWTGTDLASWDSNKWVSSPLPNGVTSKVDIFGNQGRLYVNGADANALAKSTLAKMRDAEVDLTYKFDDRGATSGFRTVLRGNGTFPLQTGYRLDVQSDITTIKVRKFTAPSTNTVIGSFTYTKDINAQHVRFRVEGGRIRVKLWPADGTAEPTNWQIDYDDPSPLTGSGSLQFSHNWTAGARTVTLDDLSLTRLDVSNEPDPQGPTAPHNSISRYVQDGPTSRTLDAGKADATQAATYNFDPYVILDYYAQNGLNGATGLNNPLSDTDIITLTKNYIDGFYSMNSGHELAIALGTNNSLMKSEDDARQKGSHWAALVASVYSQENGPHPNLTVTGAIDFESGDLFGGPAPAGPRNAKAWTAGFDSNAGIDVNGFTVVYVNYGSADYCPTSPASSTSQECIKYPQSPDPKWWTQDDYWQLTNGPAKTSKGLPEIYGSDWDDQWFQIAVYGYESQKAQYGQDAHNKSTDFWGALTEYGSDPNTLQPGPAYNNFKTTINNDSRTSQPLGYSSDIKKKVCGAGDDC